MTTFHIVDRSTKEAFDKELNTPLRPVTLLGSPYFSQEGAGASDNNNDCGAAAGLMILKTYKPETEMTVNDFYKEANPGRHDEALWVRQIRDVLSVHGIPTDYKYTFDDTMLLGCLRASKPVIALIKYARLVDAGLTEFTNFRGAHYVVIIGMDSGNIYVNDPYYDFPKGQASVYPIDIFWKAWADAVLDTNPDRAGIVPQIGIGEFVPPDPPALYKVKIICIAQRVRNGPGDNYDPPVDMLKNGTIVPVFEEQDGWGRIGFKRWIYRDDPKLNEKVLT
jgi:hypothetical protein